MWRFAFVLPSDISTTLMMLQAVGIDYERPPAAHLSGFSSSQTYSNCSDQTFDSFFQLSTYSEQTFQSSFLLSSTPLGHDLQNLLHSKQAYDISTDTMNLDIASWDARNAARVGYDSLCRLAKSAGYDEGDDWTGFLCIHPKKKYPQPCLGSNLVPKNRQDAINSITKPNDSVPDVTCKFHNHQDEAKACSGILQYGCPIFRKSDGVMAAWNSRRTLISQDADEHEWIDRERERVLRLQRDLLQGGGQQRGGPNYDLAVRENPDPDLA